MKKIFAMAFVIGACSIFYAGIDIAGADQTQGTQQFFASPADAVRALQSATESKDKVALAAIFGPQIKELLTGDQVQDEKNVQQFASVLAQGYKLVNGTNDQVTIEIGPNSWPMPIPLEKANGQWYFDTAAGKEEIINRHIGKDELYAIGVCRAFVTAEQGYASLNPESSKGVEYARRLKSTSGKKDGLYWPSVGNEQVSPFSVLVAEANAEGYLKKSFHPFHGYYFKILTSQGNNAPGGRMDYISHGVLTKGFALVAYPIRWDQSGVMTFIVNQEGKVYQRNLGANTVRLARAITEYDPDNHWTLVHDQGIQLSGQ